MNKITGGMWEGVITGMFGIPADANVPVMNRYREAAKKYAPEERFGTFYTAGIKYAEPLVDALRRVGPKPFALAGLATLIVAAVGLAGTVLAA